MVSAVFPSPRQLNIPSGEAPSPSGKQDAYALAAVDALLKNTGQWQRWQQIRQQNDERARTLAAMILERNGLVQKARAQKQVDGKHFDGLTAKLSREGIHLWDHKRLMTEAAQQSRSTSGAASSRPFPVQAARMSDGPAPKAASHALEIPTASPPVPSQPATGLTGQEGASVASIFPAERAAAESKQPLPSDSKKALPLATTEEDIPIAGIKISDSEPPAAGDTDFLILDARWENYTLASGLGAYGSPDQLFMPLGALAAILEVPIRVDQKAGKAEGEVQGKVFSLDLNAKTLTLGNESIAIHEKAFLVDEEDIYVNTSVLREWLPVDFDFIFNEMQVSFSPRERLPFEERMERQQRWNRLSAPRIVTGPSVLEEKTKPAFASMPVVDLSVSTSHNISGKKTNKGNYTLSGSGNLANATSHFYATGNDEKKLNRLEARLEKTDIEGALPLGATRMAVGDVPSPLIPIVGRPGNEQGLLVENRALYRQRDFDTTRLDGDLAPGWEVELYRGNTLLNASKADHEGRYLFEDIPLYYGVNDFRLVFYGPEGQQREEKRRLEVGTEMLPKGSFSYAASLTRQETISYEETLYPGHDTGNIRATGLMEYGLGERTTLLGGLTTDTRDNERRYRLNAGMETALTGASLRMDGVQDLEMGGRALRFSLQTALGDTRIRANQEFQDRLEGEYVSNPVRSVSDLSLSGRMGKKEGFQIPYTLSASYTDREKEYSSRISLLNSLRTGPINWSHNIHYGYDSSRSQPESTRGRLDASAMLKSIRLRAFGSYDFNEKDSGLTETGISLSRRLSRNLDVQANLRKNFIGDETADIETQLNWKYRDLTISPKFSGDDDGNWEASVNINLNTSFGLEPHRKTLRSLPAYSSYEGHASVRVFEDNNLNGVLDEEEKGLEGVRVRALQSGSTGVTDEHGIALLPLSAHLKTDIEIEETSLQDASHSLLDSGEAVTPKPGDIRPLSFAVIRTGEIDGTLYSINGAGESVILRQVEVLLKNEKGEVISRVLSEYDGFYLFERVPPGNYTVEAAWTGDGGGEEIRKSISVNVDDTGSIASGIDLVMTDKEEKAPVVAGKVPARPIKEEEFILYGKGGWTDTEGGITSTAERKIFEGQEAVLYQQGRWVPEALGAAMPKEKPSVTETRILFEAEKSAKPIKKAEPAVTSSDVPHETPASNRPAHYGLHAGSYRSREKALKGIQWAKDQMLELKNLEGAKIQPVDLGEKGLWYRVILGDFENKADADRLAAIMAEKSGYGRVLTAGSRKETDVHLASYGNIRDAEKGIANLEKQFRSLMGKDLAMSIIREGSTYRALVQNFKTMEDAEQFREKVAKMGGYARILG